MDERKQVGICNARSGDEIEAMRRVLQEFFIAMDDGLYNKRMQHEIERAEVISNQRSSAGKRGYQAKVKQLLNKSLASASTPTPTPTTTTTTTKVKNTVEKKTLDITKSFESEKRILVFLNEKTGRSYRATKVNLEFITARIAEGYSEQDCRMVIAKKTREWINDDQMAHYLRPATLFNRTKFNQYVGECVAERTD